MTRRTVLALATVVVLLGAATLAWYLSRPRITVRPIAFVGDSITDQSRDLLATRLQLDPALVAAIGGTTVEQMLPPAQALVAHQPGQVVINLGTNNVGTGEGTDATMAALQQMIALFPGARCIDVATINEHMVSAKVDVHTLAVEVNDRIRHLTSDPRIRIVDWAQIVDDYDAAHDPDGPITVDTVHPTDLGKQKLLDAYTAALADC